MRGGSVLGTDAAAEPIGQAAGQARSSRASSRKRTPMSITLDHEALFASALQRSDPITPDAVAEAISRTVGQLGAVGCASRMAEEFGEHPEAARDRMLWARQVISDLFASSGQPAQGAACPLPSARSRRSCH